MCFNSLIQSDNDKVGEGELLCWWRLEDPESPGISYLASLAACLDAPQQLWIGSEVQQKSQIPGRGAIAVQDVSQWFTS